MSANVLNVADLTPGLSPPSFVILNLAMYGFNHSLYSIIDFPLDPTNPFNNSYLCFAASPKRFFHSMYNLFFVASITASAFDISIFLAIFSGSTSLSSNLIKSAIIVGHLPTIERKAIGCPGMSV